jgi:hypothetical protein
MTTSEFAIISLETLNNLFEGKSVGEILVFENVRCVECGESVNIKIQKTSEGYGFLSGIISEPSRSQFLAKCCNCNGYKDVEGHVNLWANMKREG